MTRTASQTRIGDDARSSSPKNRARRRGPASSPTACSGRRPGSPRSLIIVLLVAIGLMLTLTSSREAFREFGLVGFITGTTGTRSKAIYGALPYIVGTLLSSVIALLIAAPIGLLTAIFLAELAPAPRRDPAHLPRRAARRDPQRRHRPVGRLRPRARSCGATVETWISSTLGMRSRSSRDRRSASACSRPG